MVRTPPFIALRRTRVLPQAKRGLGEVSLPLARRQPGHSANQSLVIAIAGSLRGRSGPSTCSSVTCLRQEGTGRHCACSGIEPGKGYSRASLPPGIPAHPMVICRRGHRMRQPARILPRPSSITSKARAQAFASIGHGGSVSDPACDEPGHTPLPRHGSSTPERNRLPPLDGTADDPLSTSQRGGPAATVSRQLAGTCNPQASTSEVILATSSATRSEKKSGIGIAAEALTCRFTWASG